MPINRASFLSASLAAMGTAAAANPALAAAPSGSAPGTGQTPQQLLDRLMAGNKRFVNSDFPTQNHVAEKREMLRDTQAPFAAILTCADSRVIPNFIFVQGPRRPICHESGRQLSRRSRDRLARVCDRTFRIASRHGVGGIKTAGP